MSNFLQIIDDIDLVLNADYDETHDLEDVVPEHSLKIYKADHTSKFLLIIKNTTTREVVMLSLKVFGFTDCSTNYALFELSVSDNGFIRTRRMPDGMQNLAHRLGLAIR